MRKQSLCAVLALLIADLLATAATAQTTGNAPSHVTPSRPIGRTHDCAQYYPTMSQRLDEGGTVQIGFDVEPDGILTHVKVLRSSGHDRLDRAAVQCVTKNWRNAPALRGGVPIRSPNHVANIQFVIDPQSSAIDAVLPQSAAPGARATTDAADPETADTGDTDALDFFLRVGGALAIAAWIVIGLRRWIFRARTCPACEASNRGIVPFMLPSYCSTCGTKFGPRDYAA